jgi:hypothetical protein
MGTDNGTRIFNRCEDLMVQPKIMEETNDSIHETEIELEFDSEEQAIYEAISGGVSESTGDLSDGGRVGGVDLFPMQDGKRLDKGRPAVRRAWMWNGTESFLTLAWDSDGKRNDGARHYLRKRHCTCCDKSGFTEGVCPRCAKNGCQFCSGKASETIIPAFYLKYADVPFKQEFYGDIDCFLPSCGRRGPRGFKMEDDMRLHAMSRHTLEYRAHMETQQSNSKTEIDKLRDQLNAALTLMGQTSAPGDTPEAVVSKDIIGTPDAPLYVKDSDK